MSLLPAKPRAFPGPRGCGQPRPLRVVLGNSSLKETWECKEEVKLGSKSVGHFKRRMGSHLTVQ